MADNSSHVGDGSEENNAILSTSLTNMSSVLVAVAELAANDPSSDQESGRDDVGHPSWRGSISSDDIAVDNEHEYPSEDLPKGPIDSDLTGYERMLRMETVRSRMGTFVIDIRTVIEHLRHVGWDVDATVASLGRAHERARTYTRGSTPGELELPDRVRNIPVEYFRTGEQERRQAADIFFLLVAQHNATRAAGTAIPLARSEALLILEMVGFDYEDAMKLIDKGWELVTQLLHIRFDNLRTRSGSENERFEQNDAALAFYATLTDRADLHSLQKHLDSHGGDVVAAVADWQEHGVDPVLHPRDRGQTQSDSWIGRRHMIQVDSHEIVLRPMPSVQEVHEYTTRTLAWRQEPHRFALTTTDIGAAQRLELFREAPIDRKNRPYCFTINHDREGLSKNCPNPRKFLIEYLEQGTYRSNGYDVISSHMKVRKSRYFWPGQGRENVDNKPIFDVNDKEHLKHFNGLYRQGYLRPTGVLLHDPGAEWSQAEMKVLWELFAGLYQELFVSARAAGKEVKLPFNVSDKKKQEMAKAVNQVDGQERSSNSIITRAHRSRLISRDFVLTFDSSNEVLRQTYTYKDLREAQIEHILQAIKQEGESLSEEDIMAALEQISGVFVPFVWDTYMAVEAGPPPPQLPSTGLSAVNITELRVEVEYALRNISAEELNAPAWERAAQVVRYYYRSNMDATETAAVRPLLNRLGLPTLNLQALAEEEGLAIFEGLARREQRKQGRGLQAQLNGLVATSRQVLSTGPASLPSGGQIDRDDVQSFGVSLEDETNGWLTDRALEAGIETLDLRNTVVVNLHGAGLHFTDPEHNPLPAIDTSAEQIAVVMHFGNHWTVGIYNAIFRQYHLLDSMPTGPHRFNTMAERMDIIVAHYFPEHGQATWAPSQSYEQENDRDCGLFVIDNIRAMDRGLPFRHFNGYQARMRILSEIMRLAVQGQLPMATSTAANANPPDKDSMEALIEEDDCRDGG